MDAPEYKCLSYDEIGNMTREQCIEWLQKYKPEMAEWLLREDKKHEISLYDWQGWIDHYMDQPLIDCLVAIMTEDRSFLDDVPSIKV